MRLFKLNKKKKIAVTAFFTAVVILMCGCTGSDIKVKNVKLDPKNPVVISVWHYYNGAIANAFSAMIKEFNDTVGAEKGIIVEDYGLGSVPELEKAVVAAAKNEVGSMDIPDIFASYADTAYEAEKMNILANLDDYLAKDEIAEFVDSYIEEGRIGLNGELRIFPVAKSTEIFMIVETDWLPFAEANGLTYDDLATLEDLTRVSKLYYEWTAKSSENGIGKAFFGRDSMANLFIIASKSFGEEIFEVTGGSANININRDVMRKIWDNYYVPYISGYFVSNSRFRSDDAKVGDIISYVGSSVSASYFPTEITTDGKVYPVTTAILPTPNFKDADRIMVQQGAGMVITKGTAETEYASVVFLKWFTEKENNVEFAALSAYMPVKKDAVNYNTVKSILDEKDISISAVNDETLKISLEEIASSEMYTNKAFDGGTEARTVLDNNLQDKATHDREEIISLLNNGIALEEAVSMYNTDEAFEQWLTEITAALNHAAN